MYWGHKSIIILTSYTLQAGSVRYKQKKQKKKKKRFWFRIIIIYLEHQSNNMLCDHNPINSAPHVTIKILIREGLLGIEPEKFIWLADSSRQ